MSSPAGFLSQREVVKMYKGRVTLGMLAAARDSGQGPQPVRIAGLRRLYYRKGEIERWASEQANIRAMMRDLRILAGPQFRYEPR
jgi:hypothetical protein